VDKPRDLRPAIERALETDGPAVVDVVTDIEAVAPTAVV
jgi:acetolactate synthase I/II/III large subunit